MANTLTVIVKSYDLNLNDLLFYSYYIGAIMKVSLFEQVFFIIDVLNVQTKFGNNTFWFRATFRNSVEVKMSSNDKLYPTLLSGMMTYKPLM